MSSVNKVILIGNLGRDPETRTFPSGDMVCNVNIATTDKWKDRETGEKKEATEWHRLVFHGRLAEIAEQYLRKGSMIYVEGQLRTRKYQDKDNIERYLTEIRVDQMQMLITQRDGEDRGGSDRGRDDRGGRGNDDRRDDRGGDRGGDSRGNGGGRGGYQDQRGRDEGYGRGNDRGGHDSRRGDPPPAGRAAAPAPRAPAPAPRAPAPARGGNTGFDDMDSDIPF